MKPLVSSAMELAQMFEEHCLVEPRKQIHDGICRQACKEWRENSRKIATPSGVGSFGHMFG